VVSITIEAFARNTSGLSHQMSENINITLSPDEALVLFDFFSRFCDDDDDFTLRHTAEYLAFMRISAQLDKALVEPFQPQYLELLRAARDRIAAGFEGQAPGVQGDVA
jgi:hypothetical protein